MYELSCPNCSAAAQYDFNDYLLMCPFCSTSFRRDEETGQKEIYSDHYIIPHAATPAQVKSDVVEWLSRMHHRQGAVNQEYKVKTLRGLCIPYWIVSMEVHTAWKGLVKRETRQRLDTHPGADWLTESGQFKRNYRWAVSARNNICESWGLTRLHKPKEQITVEWDGFPLDSTFSRGQIRPADASRGVYDARERFDTKYSNGLPIIGVQIAEEEALRRARYHVEQYHLQLARLNVDFLIDFRTEIEVAGVQLVHLPFWFATYFYQPRSALRHVMRPREKHVLIAGYNNGILDGELALKRNDKIWVNAIICGLATVLFFLLGIVWHPAFLLVALFCACVAGGSAYLAAIKGAQEDGKAPLLDAEPRPNAA